jgi:lipoprotein-anchoring transpeptidase ErfK/SrfK
MRRLPVLALVAVAAPLVLADAVATDSVQAAQQPAAAGGPSAFARAREGGQPIAVLKRATVLRARPTIGGRRMAKVPAKTEFGTPTVLAALAERGNWLKVMATQLPNSRSAWIPTSAAGSIVASRWRLTADLSRRTVTVVRDGRVVRRFPVAIGKPTTPTPIGRFAVTDKLDFIGGSSAYGCCALALTGHQTHIEPGWSGGDRLAIHGTRQVGTIGAAASFGCLRARDEDVRWIVHHVYLGSIVRIRP